MENNQFISWGKGTGAGIWNHKYFMLQDFECRCTYKDCIKQLLSNDLLERLTSLRDLLGVEFQITSAFRCAKHQADISKAGKETAAGISQHQLGTASDILFDKNTSISNVLIATKTLFDSIGVNYLENWLHVDLRPAYPDGSKRIWKYKR